MDKITRSLAYKSLDYKWLSRMLLKTSMPDDEGLKDMAFSAFEYYDRYYYTLKGDRSLAAITDLCTDDVLRQDINGDDEQVFLLSHVFNHIIGSERKVFKCYDCGTNARAIFIRLVQTMRIAEGRKPIVTLKEQIRMKDEYVVDYDNPTERVRQCRDHILESKTDLVVIMSVSIEEFGHVWVIEKRFFNGVPRYHHYQSSLSSHLLIDFIEDMDYGSDPMQSIDITGFMGDVEYILGVVTPWTDSDLRLFVKLFRFIPIRDVIKPKPGFSWTSIEGNPGSP